MLIYFLVRGAVQLQAQGHARVGEESSRTTMIVSLVEETSV